MWLAVTANPPSMRRRADLRPAETLIYSRFLRHTDVPPFSTAVTS
jgi:hypothetical protein